MKRLFFSVLFITLGIGAYFGYTLFTNQPKEKQEIETTPVRRASMTIASRAFSHNTRIPAKYTCDGENVNPPLTFSGVPKEAKSLALIVDDPDAPSKTWVHWVLYNISPNITFIEENSRPSNSQEGLTDFGKPGYGGPCPPPVSSARGGKSGVHRYFFKLYALDVKLEDMPEFTDKDMLEEAMEGHVIATAQLIGLYSRS
jgi:Raf kinase inhibitor-like YbhB/YbcL family protein